MIEIYLIDNEHYMPTWTMALKASRMKETFFVDSVICNEHHNRHKSSREVLSLEQSFIWLMSLALKNSLI
jgi:hypothetical protein